MYIDDEVAATLQNALKYYAKKRNLDGYEKVNIEVLEIMIDRELQEYLQQHPKEEGGELC